MVAVAAAQEQHAIARRLVDLQTLEVLVVVLRGGKVAHVKCEIAQALVTHLVDRHSFSPLPDYTIMLTRPCGRRLLISSMLFLLTILKPASVLRRT